MKKISKPMLRALDKMSEHPGKMFRPMEAAALFWGEHKSRANARNAKMLLDRMVYFGLAEEYLGHYLYKNSW